MIADGLMMGFKMIEAPMISQAIRNIKLDGSMLSLRCIETHVFQPMQLVSNQLETPVRLRSAWLISVSCSWKNFSFEATNLSGYPLSHLALPKSAMGIVQPGFGNRRDPLMFELRQVDWQDDCWFQITGLVMLSIFFLQNNLGAWSVLERDETNQSNFQGGTHIFQVAWCHPATCGILGLADRGSPWPRKQNVAPKQRKDQTKTWRLGEVVEASAPGFVWESKEAIGENLSPQAGVVDITANLQPSHHGRGWRPQLQPPEVCFHPSQVYYGCVISSILWVWMAGGYNSIIMYAISRFFWTLVTPKIDLWSGFDFYVWAIEVEECFCVLFRGDGPQWFSIFGALQNHQVDLEDIREVWNTQNSKTTKVEIWTSHLLLTYGTCFILNFSSKNANNPLQT